MKKNELIEREIDRVEDLISNLEFSSWSRLGLSVLLWLASFYVGILLANYYPMIAGPICLGGFGLPILGAHDCFSKRSKIKNQKLYLEHLKNIVKNGVDKTTENIDVRRLDAIERHQKVLDLNSKRTTLNTIIGSLGIGAWIIGAIVAYFSKVGALVSGIGLTSLAGVAYKSYKENEIKEEEESRIDAIHSDLVYGVLYPKQVTNSIDKSQEKVQTEVDKKVYDKDLERIADQIVEELANEGKELSLFSDYKAPYVKK